MIIPKSTYLVGQYYERKALNYLRQQSIETVNCRFDICAFDQRQLIWLKNILDHTEFIR
ncbi:hypothetical protein [Proteus mirabilis]|uniref:hypothetical protein n=1 Tax=Proteus mirabilis TaxID=584 RepID=UPI0033159AA9